MANLAIEMPDDLALGLAGIAPAPHHHHRMSVKIAP